MAGTRILFVCLHGSAKSVIAASYCERLAAGRGLHVRAESAGVEPDAAIPAHVVNGLGADGFDVSASRPRAAGAAGLAGVARVVAFGCEPPPVPAGVPVERWDDVPAVSEDFSRTRDAIVARLQRLLGDLVAAR